MEPTGEIEASEHDVAYDDDEFNWLGVYPCIKMAEFSGRYRRDCHACVEADHEYDLSPILKRSVRSVYVSQRNYCASSRPLRVSACRLKASSLYCVRGDRYLGSSSYVTSNPYFLSFRYFALTHRWKSAHKMLAKVSNYHLWNKETNKLIVRGSALIQLMQNIPVLDQVVDQFVLQSLRGMYEYHYTLHWYFAMKFMEAFEGSIDFNLCLESINKILNNHSFISKFETSSGRKLRNQSTGFDMYCHMLFAAYFSLLNIVCDERNDQSFVVLSEEDLRDEGVSELISSIEQIFNSIFDHKTQCSPLDSLILMYCDVLRMQQKMDSLEHALVNYRTKFDTHSNAHIYYLDFLDNDKKEVKVDDKLDVMENVLDINPYDPLLPKYYTLTLDSKNPSRLCKLCAYLLKNIDCACTLNSFEPWSMLVSLIKSIADQPEDFTDTFAELNQFRTLTSTYWNWFLMKTEKDRRLMGAKLFINYCFHPRNLLPFGIDLNEKSKSIAHKVNCALTRNCACKLK